MAALTLVVALAAFQAPAEARFTDRDADASVRVAWGYWHSLRPKRFDRPGYRCGPHNVRVNWKQDLGTAMATAQISGCRDDPPTINLERPTIEDLSDVGACGIITHEFGHLLGFRHVKRSKQIMSGARSAGDKPPVHATWARAWARCRGQV